MKAGILLTLVLLILMSPVQAQGETQFSPYSITTYNLTYSVTLHNLGPSDAFDIPLRVALLGTWQPHQSVSEISVEPEPDERYVDFLNNSFVIYHVKRLAPEERFTVRVHAVLNVYSMDYNIEPRQVGTYNENDSNYKNYIVPSKFIESDDPQIQATARDILRDSNTLLDTIFKTYNWVIDNIEYEKIPGEVGALYAYKNREGDSAEFSNLFIALLRANGIPSRRISGWGGSLDEGGEYTSTQVAHGWAEFYVLNYGWIPADPTFGRLHRWDNFAKADNKHIILTKGSDVHFYTRGLYNAPYGEADVLTYYNISVHQKTVRYVSPERNVIIFIFFFVPMIFFVFIIVKIRKERAHPSQLR